MILPERKNKLVIIGNGFDLAHGMKTSYKSFLMWLLEQLVYYKIWNTTKGEHPLFQEIYTLINIDKGGRIGLNKYPGNPNFNEIFEWIKSCGFKLSYRCSFIEDVFQSHINNWVDLETLYYNSLIKIYKKYSLDTSPITPTVKSELLEINYSLELIKESLRLYLKKVSNENEAKLLGDIRKHFIHDILKDVSDNQNIIFLNFNYTSTVENYFQDFQKLNITLINIHGDLKDDDNPMIFGYGDEMDFYYEKIETLNENEFLTNIKSFKYYQSTNYQNLFSILNNADYDVFIMGHSCGTSDRVLLNSIFQNERAKSIKIYYHEWGNQKNDNDYIEKTINISRHFKPNFKPNFKQNMRLNIVPFSRDNALVKFKIKNDINL